MGTEVGLPPERAQPSLWPVVDDAEVNRWVNAETLPNIMMVAPLARALGVKPELVYDPPERPEYPISDYLVRVAGEAAIAEGISRARRLPKRGGL